MRPIVLVILSVCLAACGGQTASSSSHSSSGTDASVEDAGAGGDGAGSPGPQTGFLTVLSDTGCLPQSLPEGEDGIACTVYEVLPDGAPCQASEGLGAVDASVAATVRARAPAPSSDTVCVLDQLVPAAGASCAASTTPGWCYVTGAAAGSCPQTIVFSPGAPEPGAIALLGCP